PDRARARRLFLLRLFGGGSGARGVTAPRHVGDEKAPARRAETPVARSRRMQSTAAGTPNDGGWCVHPPNGTRRAAEDSLRTRAMPPHGCPPLPPFTAGQPTDPRLEA